MLRSPKRRLLSQQGWGALRESVHTQDCHFLGIVFDGLCVIWISLSEGDQDKTNSPSSLFLSSMNLDVGKALVDKDAEGCVAQVELAVEVRPVKVPESVS